MKKLLASLLSVMMVMCFMPSMAWAADEVAMVNGTPYSSLSEAFEKANDGDTIEVIKEVSEGSSTISFTGKKLKLDLKGQTVTLKSIVANNATLIIEDSTATANPVVSEDYKVDYTAGKLKVSHTVSAVSGGSVILNSGIIESNNLGMYAEGDLTGANEILSTVTMNGGYVIAQEFALTPQGKGASVNFLGGVAEAKDNAVIAGNGTNTATEKRGGTTINIEGGTLIGHITTSGYAACGVYHPQEGTLNIKDGIIYADNGCGVLMRGGDLNMTGGTIVATGADDFTAKVGDSRVVVPTSGIVFDKDCGYYDVDAANIVVGGNASVSGSKAAISVVATDNELASKQVKANGGEFSSDVLKYVPEGKSSVALNSAGTTTYYVGEAEDVAVAVQNAVKSGDEITVQQGALELNGVADGVTVDNQGSGEVSVNKTPVIKGTPVKTYTPVYIPPTTQTPTIEADENATVTLSDYGTKATIKVADGYELVDVTVNGESKGKVDTLTGLKTGDKVVVTTKKIEEPVDPAAEAARIKAGVENTTLKIYSGKTGKGDGWIQIRWVKSKGFKVDGYEVYRGKTKSSMKKYDTTKKTSYKNAKYLKKGNRYYYKVRGYRMVGDEKVYTKWSKTIYRIAK